MAWNNELPSLCKSAKWRRRKDQKVRHKRLMSTLTWTLRRGHSSARFMGLILQSKKEQRGGSLRLHESGLFILLSIWISSRREWKKKQLCFQSIFLLSAALSVQSMQLERLHLEKNDESTIRSHGDTPQLVSRWGWGLVELQCKGSRRAGNHREVRMQ